MSVYEVHLGSWRPGLSYRELADELVAYVKDRGFTHVEFMPVAEHPFGGSWGYQVTSYYAPSARFGDPDDFRHLVDRLHQAGIGVFVDWVPAHFPRDSWALARFDGTSLYEHPDPRRGEHPDWGTLIFDYGRPEVRNFLVANALYWLEEYHIDGLRVDAVASMLYLDYSRGPDEWTPNVLGGRENLDAVAFLQEVNATAYKRSRGIVMIAEESTAWPGVTRPVHLGGLGFGLKWNLGWMHDTLAYLAHDPLFRRYHHNELTFSMMYAYSENFVLPLSHDEVVHGKGSLLGKMPGDDWKKFASLRALFAYMWAHPGKQLLFMGSEFGQRAEWSQENGLDWAALAGPRTGRLAPPYRRPERGLPQAPGPVAGRLPPGRVQLDRRQRRDGQRNLVPALRRRRPAAGLRGELRRRTALRLPGRPAQDGALARGDQHRRQRVRRQRRGQLRIGAGGGQALARPPGLGRADRPPLATMWLVHDKSHDQSHDQPAPKPASVIAKDDAQPETSGRQADGRGTGSASTRT